MVGNDEPPAAVAPPPLETILSECVGCEWTLAILARVRAGVRRPGAIERAVPGLTAKVLNERLVRLVEFALLERRAYPEIPPRVEYHLTPFGERFAAGLDHLEGLRAEFAGGANDPAPPAAAR